MINKVGNLLRHHKIAELLFGFFLAVLLVIFYNSRKIDAENLALGNQNISAIESWQGRAFTGYSPPTIKKLITGISEHSTDKEKNTYWLWLGNSQLHTINQRQPEDHLAPYWLRKALPCSGCPVPLGVSVPNANLQEFLLLDRYVQQHVKIKGLIVELPFIGLREEGIRSELAAFVDSALEKDLSNTSSGRSVVETIRNSSEKDAPSGDKKATVAEEDFQKRMERQLESAMGSLFPVWEARGLLKAYFLIDVYYAKNWLLGIKPTTVRKMIDSRYERNMNALRDMLKMTQKEHQAVLVYIAPIRQDLAMPYETDRYQQWKTEVEKLSAQYGAKYLNLEKAVPAAYWGTYHDDDVDFIDDFFGCRFPQDVAEMEITG